MIPQPLWRHNIGWLAGVVAFPFMWIFVNANFHGGGQNYPTDLTANATFGAFIFLVSAAATAAWEGVRLTPLHQTLPTTKRSPISVVILTVAPTIISSWIGLTLLIVLKLHSAGLRPPIPDLAIMAGSLAAQVAAALLGLFIGTVVSSFFAAPLAGVLVYFLAILQVFIFDERLALLYGKNDDCCALNQAIDVRALLVPVAATVGICLLTIIAVCWRWWRRPRFWLASSILGVICLTWAVWAPFQLANAAGIVPRRGAMICEVSRQTGIRYCVWPEHSDLVSEVASFGDRAFATWETNTPILAPNLVTEKIPENNAAEVIGISIGSQPNYEDVVSALALGMLPEFPKCKETNPGQRALPYILSWWLLSAGVDPGSPRLQQFDFPGPPGNPAPFAFANQLDEASRAEQQEWLDQALHAFSTCDTPVHFSLS